MQIAHHHPGHPTAVHAAQAPGQAQHAAPPAAAATAPATDAHGPAVVLGGALAASSSQPATPATQAPHAASHDRGGRPGLVA
jgi:hypothetical protein